MNNDKLDLDQIRAVVQIASEADISELEVESPALKISVTADGGKVSQVGFGFAKPAGSSVYAKVPDKKEGVLVSTSGKYRGRACLHLDVTAAQVNEALSVMKQVVNAA